MKRFEGTLKMLEGAYDETPATKVYVQGLLSRIDHEDPESGNPGLTLETFILDTVTLLQFFESRLNALEEGKPAPK